MNKVQTCRRHRKVDISQWLFKVRLVKEQATILCKPYMGYVGISLYIYMYREELALQSPFRYIQRGGQSKKKKTK